MVLNRHGSLLSVHHTSTCAIIQVDVCHLHTFRQCLGIYGIVVILCADLNASCKAGKVSLKCARLKSMLNRYYGLAGTGCCSSCHASFAAICASTRTGPYA